MCVLNNKWVVNSLGGLEFKGYLIGVIGQKKLFDVININIEWI